MVVLAGICFLSVLWQVDEAIPFSGAGDDNDYFNASKQSFNSVSDWFDLRQFKWTHEQAGYPLVLSWVHQFVGDSLYLRKALNVFFFLMLGLVWFEIGRQIGGRRLGFVYASGVLLATPLWFYWIFLLKDMVIVFLQSIVILGLVQSLSHRSVARGYGLIVLSTVLILPFRSMLALVNLAALAGATFLRTGSGWSWKGALLKVAMTGGIIISILVVGRNPEILHQLGVAGEHRVLGIEAVQAELEMRGRSRSAQFTSVLKFPILYLVGEVAAFNPKSWEAKGTPLIRGLSMVPWIYVGVPLFVTGAWMIVRQPRTREGAVPISAGQEGHPLIDPERPERALLLVLLLFVLIYAGVAWASADTTRWRMSAMPPMVAIAGLAWVRMNLQQRFWMLLSWGLLLSVSLIVYYAVLR
ncbi:MAG TPA: hypothetical protein PKK23_08955 [Nitrospirales bacterium]|nr:hypothetical protein [Nitrospirales bacterium]